MPAMALAVGIEAIKRNPKTVHRTRRLRQESVASPVGAYNTIDECQIAEERLRGMREVEPRS
jgi:hypothetical protein